LFRKISFNELKHLQNIGTNKKIKFENIITNNQEISCNFLKTENGFIITVIDIKNNIRLSISENGLIKKYKND
jgi:hypothetical protein